MAAQPVAPPPRPRPNALRNSSLYVGDLDPQVTESDLSVAFSHFGPLTSVRICRDMLSHKSLRYGYVNFMSPSDASKAMACLNHTKLKGKPVRIMCCQRDPLIRKTGIGNLFVKNLAPSVTSARLQRIFCKFGPILSCKVAEENGTSKGFGFVHFESENSSMAALNALHGTVHEGKKLYVSKFMKKSERKDAHEEPNITHLFVKNLGDNVTEDDLKDRFPGFGKVCGSLIAKDIEGKSTGFGLVSFESHEAAKKAVEALNGTLQEKLFVGMSQKKAERKDLPNCLQSEKLKASNLYVKNLDASVDDEKLEHHFSIFGKVTSAKVMRHDNEISKGFGFVSFSTPEEAKNAMEKLHGTVFEGRPLYVAIAQRKEERQRLLQSYIADYRLKSLYSSSSSSCIITPYFHPFYYSFYPFRPLNPPASCICFPKKMMHPSTHVAPRYYFPMSRTTLPCLPGS